MFQEYHHPFHPKTKVGGGEGEKGFEIAWKLRFV
jgi:hypothetical protein